MREEELALDMLQDERPVVSNSKESIIKFSSFYPINSFVSYIVLSELTKYMSGIKCNLINQKISIDLMDLQLESHYIHKNHNCTICSGGVKLRG